MDLPPTGPLRRGARICDASPIFLEFRVAHSTTCTWLLRLPRSGPARLQHLQEDRYYLKKHKMTRWWTLFGSWLNLYATLH
jgi:hypothetical protein